MPRSNDVYSLPAGYLAIDGQTIQSSQHNTPLEDLEADANAVRPQVYGGTGAASLDAATVTPADGVAGALADHLSAGGLVASTFPSIQSAVAAALSSGRPLWVDQTIAATGNIPDLHNVRLVGAGAITRGGETWHATPRGDQTNILYFGPSGSTSNDGLTADTPLTWGAAWDVIRKYGDKTGDGQWRLQGVAGTIEDNVSPANLPYFRNPLQVWGASVDETASAVPTTIIDGTNEGATYALRIDNSAYPSASIHLEVKNLKFTNWPNSGGIVAWGPGVVRAINVHADNTVRIGVWTRQNYLRVLYGVYKCTHWGVGGQYNSTVNVGNLSGGGVRFEGCETGVHIGRCGIGYVQGSTFVNCETGIAAQWLSRMRPQANDFSAINGVPFSPQGNSLLTLGNTGDQRNIYPTLTEAAPAVWSVRGSVDTGISQYSQKTLHKYSGSQQRLGLPSVMLFDVTTASRIALSDPAYGGSDFVPFRLPAYALFSPTFELEVSIGMAFGAGAGGTLELHGQGDGANTKLAELVIPNVAGFTRGRALLRVTNSPGFASGRFEVEYKPLGLYSEGPIENFNSTAVRDSSEDQLIFRLYWQSNNTNQVTIYNMRSYVYE